MSLSLQDYNKLREKIFDKFLNGLNSKQKEAVLTTKGSVLILAGAGSGKTTVIINRIAFMLMFGNCAMYSDTMPQFSDSEISMLKECALNGKYMEEVAKIIAVEKPNPWNILAITFTNKAAGELRERLQKKLGCDGESVAAGTFHSTCSKILRREIDRLGYTSDFTIYDTDDSLRIIKQCMEELSIDEKRFPPRAFISLISSAKDNLTSFEEMQSVYQDEFLYKVTGQIYQKYQEKLKKANALDFDDIIVLTVKLFKEYPEVLEKYRNRWKYIMVDEYQDTNHTQYTLVSMLAGSHGNICVVGDDDQSIYKFRGATIENILSFEEQFKGTKVIKLEQNYRCSSKILDAANIVIAQNTKRKAKTLWTKNEEGENIQLYSGNDDRREALFIANTIEKNHAKGITYNSHAILYRMNSQSNTIEQMFIQRGIPYKIIGGRKFFDRKEIKDILAYMQLVNNNTDNLRLTRIVNEPKRGLGDATIDTVEEISNMLGLSMLEVMLNANEYAPLSKKANGLIAFAQMIKDISNETDSSTVLDIFEMILEKSGYVTALKQKNDFESQGRLENIDELRNTIVKYIEETEDPTLSGFLEEIALYTELDGLSEDDDAVTMMTLHSAKGLEFPYVFIAGMEENIFPGQRSIVSLSELEEERRLAYVGITRAKKQLFITTAQQRMLNGRTTRNPISRFANDIPKEILDIKSDNQYDSMGSYGGYSGYGSGRISTPTYTIPTAQKPISKPQPKATPKAEPFSFKAGDRIHHKTFGNGKIMSVTPMGTDNMVEIAFDTGATKRLMTSYIKLEPAKD